MGTDVTCGLFEVGGVAAGSLGCLAGPGDGLFVEGDGVEDGADLMVEPVVGALDAVGVGFVLVGVVERLLRGSELGGDGEEG